MLPYGISLRARGLYETRLDRSGRVYLNSSRRHRSLSTSASDFYYDNSGLTFFVVCQMGCQLACLRSCHIFHRRSWTDLCCSVLRPWLQLEWLSRSMPAFYAVCMSKLPSIIERVKLTMALHNLVINWTRTPVSRNIEFNQTLGFDEARFECLHRTVPVT